MQTVVTTILTTLEHTYLSRVTRVQLEIGASEHFTEEAVRQYFQLLTQGTPIEGAELELTWLPAHYQCLSCQQPFESCAASGLCPYCGEVGWEIAHRDSCVLRSIEVVAINGEAPQTDTETRH